ncbi:MAG TPA: hypothetical protein VLL98_00655 [Rickettsiales bacterium]|nr:hypothetical protein [Rickettsiales bacterium]
MVLSPSIKEYFDLVVLLLFIFVVLFPIVPILIDPFPKSLTSKPLELHSLVIKLQQDSLILAVAELFTLKYKPCFCLVNFK